MATGRASEIFQNLATALVAAVALTMLGLRLYDRSADDRRIRELTYGEVADQTPYQSGGHVRGSPSALLTIVEYADFECPVCRQAVPLLDSILRENGDRVALRFKHYPLSFHKSARTAAVAAVCAEEVGKFDQYSSLLWAAGDSLGSTDWGQLARQAGIRDEVRFVDCLESERALARVLADSISADGLKLRGTPTMVVGSTSVTGLPANRQELRDLVAAELAKTERKRSKR